MLVGAAVAPPACSPSPHPGASSLTSGQTLQSASLCSQHMAPSTYPCFIPGECCPSPDVLPAKSGAAGPSWHWTHPQGRGEGERLPRMARWECLEVSFPFPVIGVYHSPRDLHQAPKTTGLLSPQLAHLEKTVGQALCRLQSMFQKEQSPRYQAGHCGALADFRE